MKIEIEVEEKILAKIFEAIGELKERVAVLENEKKVKQSMKSIFEDAQKKMQESNKMKLIFGPGSTSILSSGDAVTYQEAIK